VPRPACPSDSLPTAAPTSPSLVDGSSEPDLESTRRGRTNEDARRTPGCTGPRAACADTDTAPDQRTAACTCESVAARPAASSGSFLPLGGLDCALMAVRRRSGSRPFSLTPLRAAVDRAVLAASAPPAAGEIKQILSIEDLHAGSRLGGGVGRDRSPEGAPSPDLRTFLGEATLAAAIVEELAQHPRVRTVDGLRRRLAARADVGGKWLVATPLANATLTREVVALSDELMLVRLDERRSAPPGPSRAARAVRRQFDDRLPLYLRHRVTGRDGHELDTRAMVALVSVEEVGRLLALSRVRTRASYSLAMWCLLRRPTHEQVWPSVAAWVPQPYVDIGLHNKPYEPGQWMGRTRATQRTITFAEYELPAQDEELRVPVEAIATAPTRRWATAVLSAAWSLFLAERFPNSLEQADRILHVFNARAALCEPPTPSETEADKRWRRLLDRLHVRRDLRRRGYRDEALRLAERRLQHARNISAHGADSFLLNFGYPAGAARKVYEATGATSRADPGGDRGRSPADD
jgi:hypothetical protein